MARGVPLFTGRILTDRPLDGWVLVDGGRIQKWGKGAPDPGLGPPTADGWIVPAPVNAHTHVGDTFLRERAGKPTTVKELVGPGGWKHQHLASADPVQQAAGIERIADEMAAIGTAAFLDFREGGVAGIEAVRRLDLPVRPVLFGRGTSARFDEDEAHAVAQAADGIGISGVRDFSANDLDAWSDVAKEHHKPLAIHVSEARREDLDQALSLDPAFVVHMVHATTEDLDDLADARVPVVVCPRSNAHFGLTAPVDRMLEAGVEVAVGSDNGMLSDGDVRKDLAVLRDRFALDDATLLSMACHTGRRVAGLPPVRLERGAPADLVVLPARPFPEPQRRRPVLGVRAPEPTDAEDAA